MTTTPRFEPGHQPPETPSDEAWCFVFLGRELCLLEGSAGSAPAAPPLSPVDRALLGRLDETLAAAARADAAARAERHFLGRLDGRDAWAYALPGQPCAEGGPSGSAPATSPLPLPAALQAAPWTPRPLRAAMLALDSQDARLAGLAGRAAQILEWDRSHRHCGACGTLTERHPGERSRVCPACGLTAYPRLSPAMMALVWRPGELLLARSPHYTPGMYSALAGFVEPGESIEDCLHREVAEEVAVRVEAPVYYGSQSWPFPHSLMVAYIARWAGGEIVPQDNEIEDARWFPIDALPAIPPRFSIAGHLIRDSLARMQQGLAPDGR
ncbi:MAG: diphosphatase [Pseudomonadota bacterium]|jgi:NAD+ diphosphatase